MYQFLIIAYLFTSNRQDIRLPNANYFIDPKFYANKSYPIISYFNDTESVRVLLGNAHAQMKFFHNCPRHHCQFINKITQYIQYGYADTRCKFGVAYMSNFLNVYFEDLKNFIDERVNTLLVFTYNRIEATDGVNMKVLATYGQYVRLREEERKNKD